MIIIIEVVPVPGTRLSLSRPDHLHCVSALLSGNEPFGTRVCAWIFFSFNMQPGGNSGGVLAVAILALLLGTLCVALRIYTRKVVLNQLWVDDYLACASWVSRVSLKRSFQEASFYFHS